MKIRKLVLFTMLLASGLGAYAQTDEGNDSNASSSGSKPGFDVAHRRWSIGLQLGATLPYTDVTQYQLEKVAFGGEIGEVQPIVGISLQRQLSPVFSAYTRFSVGRLQGYRSANVSYNIQYLRALHQLLPDEPANNLSIISKTPIISGELGMIINFSNFSFHYNAENKMKKNLYYGSLGLGWLYHDPVVEFAPSLETSSSPAGENFRNTSGISFPYYLGFGVRRHLSTSIDLGLELNYVFANSDYVDGAMLAGSSYDSYATFNVTMLYNLKGKNGSAESYAMHWVHPTDMLLEAHHGNDESGADATAEAEAPAKDSDGDGIPDDQDDQVYSPFGAKVDDRGIAVDSDKDGVPDGIDLEPDTPEGMMVNFQGKGMKVPGSGPATDPTPSPSEAKTVMPVTPPSSRGGSGTIPNVAQADVAYFPSVYFSINSAAVRGDQVDKIVRVGRTMQENQSLNIKLVGHADKSGNPEYNKVLTEKRAQSVKDFLVNNLHIEASRITIEVKGDSDPVSKTLNYINRRVDVVAN